MFKAPIEYNDFSGVSRKEDFYFHLSLPEVVRLEAELGKPLNEYAKEISDGKDLNQLLAFLEKIVLNSYGKKTQDGKSFHKSQALREEFEHSNAYAELFEQMLMNPELARRFGESVADNGKQKKKNILEPEVVTE